jgi:DNA-binding NarL/FixJ family response regulator
LLIDDHPILRKGLAELINQEADMTVCGEAEGSAEGVRGHRGAES